MVAGCGVPVRRDWGFKCPQCHGTLSSNTQPWLWPSVPQPYITGPADRWQMGPTSLRSLSLKPPGFTVGFPQSILMFRLSLLLDIGRLQSRGSRYRCFRWTWSVQFHWYTAGHKAETGWALSLQFSICMHVFRDVVGFHSIIWVLIDWYFHYGCRVAWRLLICSRVLQVYVDCSGARRKAE